MSILIKEGQVYSQGKIGRLDIYIDDLGQLALANDIALEDSAEVVIDATEMLIIPGLINPLTPLKSNQISNQILKQISKGGYTTVFLATEDDDLDKINRSLTAIKDESCIHAHPFASLNKTNQDSLVDMVTLSTQVYGFYHNDMWISEETITQAMKNASLSNSIIVTSYNNNQEAQLLKRDVHLVKESQCSYHISNLTSIDSIEVLKQAKQEGLTISADITMEQLLLETAHQEKYIDAINQGIIEMISCSSSIDFEYTFGLAYQHLVLTRKITLEKIIDCMSYNVANIFGIDGGDVINFEKANLAIIDLKGRKKLSSKNLDNSVFINWYVMGLCKYTIVDGEIIYNAFAN